MNKKEIFGWTMYDWANSAFATTMMAAVLPIYYHDVAAKGVDSTTATAFWGYSQTIAIIIVAVLSPILGAVADSSYSKSKFVRGFALIGIISCLLFAFVGQGDWLLASLLFVLGTVGFSGGNAFYDAFLPEIAPKNQMDRISSRGYAFGYIGGGLLLLINLLMIMKYQWFLFPDATTATKAVFVTVGIWWLLFSIPFFRHVKDKRPSDEVKRKGTSYRDGFRRVAETFKEIKQYKELLKFLIAFWIFNDGISTIIKMATIYGRDIGIGQTDLIAALLITQFVGIPFSFFFGWLSGRIAAKKALLIALWIYVLIVGLGYFMTSAWQFYLLAFMVGIVQGGAQALSRSIFGQMIPEGRSAEYYGFFGISSKFSSVFGPFLFALVAQLTGTSRLGIISVALFFLVGIFMLMFVDIEKGEAERLKRGSKTEVVV
jgi:UMF1 family MFS transporter